MKNRMVVGMVLAAVAMVGVGRAVAQAKPDFSGTWKLNLQKSDLGQYAPDSETYTVTQTAEAIKVAIASAGQFALNYTFSAKLDGTETPIAADAFPADSPFKVLTSKAEWKDKALVITQTTSFQDAKGTLVSTYTLSDDGKTLTKVTHVVFDQGNFDSKSVYDKG